MGLDDVVRVIIDENDVFMNLALDEVCLEMVGEGESPETLRFSHVTKPAISLGANQSADEVDIEACREAGWQVCRRKSGGTLAFLDPADKILVSYIYKKKVSDIDQVAHTRNFCLKIMRGLKSLGIDYIELWNKCDIMARAESGEWRKIGSAAAEFGANAALIHATINYNYPQYQVGRLLRVVRPFGQQIPDDVLQNTVQIAHGFVTSISELAHVNREEVYSALKWQFGTDVQQSVWTELELSLARERAHEIKKPIADREAFKHKGLCDFGLGAHIPSFVIHAGKPVALPAELMMRISERHQLLQGELQLIQSVSTEQQVAAYQTWLASLS